MEGDASAFSRWQRTNERTLQSKESSEKKSRRHGNGINVTDGPTWLDSQTMTTTTKEDDPVWEKNRDKGDLYFPSLRARVRQNAMHVGGIGIMRWDEMGFFFFFFFFFKKGKGMGRKNKYKEKRGGRRINESTP